MFLSSVFKKNQSISTKSNNSNPVLPFMMGDLLYDGWYDILAYQALLYYRMVSSLNTAIDMVVDEFANIKPHVYDKKKNVFLDEHPVLGLLNHPMGDMTWTEFAKELGVYFLVTGNSYTVLGGNVNNPPLEMYNAYPANINILPSSLDGFNQQIDFVSAIGSTSFYRNTKLVPGYFRFIDKLDKKEIWQIKTFNARQQYGYGQYGMSQLTPIYYEIEQFLQANIFNNNFLKNNATPGFLFSTDQALTQQSFDRLRDQIRQKYEGVFNAGRSVLLDSGLKGEPVKINNRDMQFIELRRDVSAGIFNKLKVPLPLVSAEHTTMNNLENAVLMLYDRAVLPLADRMFQELTLLLMPRYKGSEDLIITYKKEEITALEPRRMAQIKLKADLGALTVNEIRSMQGYDEVPDGDVILIPTASTTLENLVAEPEEDDKDEQQTDPAKDYTEALNAVKFADGISVKKHYEKD